MADSRGGEDQAELGHDILIEVSNGMVRAQKEFFGKGPESAKTYIVDDLLITVMRGGLTTAEKTMLDFGHADQVRSFRQLLENEMTERLTNMISKITGRRVLTYQSQVLFGPDVVVEIFVLDDVGGPAAIATAEGQLGKGPAGESDAEELEGPSESGQRA